ALFRHQTPCIGSSKNANTIALSYFCVLVQVSVWWGVGTYRWAAVVEQVQVLQYKPALLLVFILMALSSFLDQKPTVNGVHGGPNNEVDASVAALAPYLSGVA